MRNNYTKELLEPVVAKSTTMAEVCRKLNIKPFTGAQSHLKSRIKNFGIDFSHFLGQAHNRGKGSLFKKSISEYLVYGSTINSDKLKKKLFNEGLKKEICEDCDLVEWYGKKAPLELDHLNGDPIDNRLENLRIRCANCHAIKNK